MTTFDEHSRDEVFRDYLRHAQAAEQWVVDQSAKLSNYTAYHVGRGQVHAMLAQAAATLLAGTPEVESVLELKRRLGNTKLERDVLRDRVDELVAQGLAPHAPGTTPLCTCGHHVDRHYAAAGHCRDCTCTTYVPNTSEVDGWSEPAARGARFRVARFEQNGHVPPVFFKVTDQRGVRKPVEFPTEAGAQGYAETLNRMTSVRTDASVETEAPSRLHTDTPTTE